MMNPKLTFSSAESERWFQFVINNWRPRHDNVVLVPCAKTKPFHRSITHRNFLKNLWESWLNDEIDLVIVSEPLTVVPAEYDYPEAQYPLYDYPPALIKEGNGFTKLEKRIWRYRFTLFMRLIDKNNCYFILYPYHRAILGGILEKFCVGGIYVERPYIVKGLELLRSMINNHSLASNGFMYVNSSIKILPFQTIDTGIIKK